jgi:hypothetical protein
MHLISSVGDDAAADAAELRARAARLRSLSRRLRATRAMQLFRRAGADTWVGATPSRCLDELEHVRRTIATAADELDAAARRLESQAMSGSSGGGSGVAIAR